MDNIRWSDKYQSEKDFRKQITLWYNQALQMLSEGKYTIMGKPINLNDPKEIATVFYLIARDYDLFHEKF